MFSSKNSAYSSAVSKRRSKHERKLGFGSFGQKESFLSKINKQGSPIHQKSTALVEDKSPGNRLSRSQRRQMSENKRVTREVQDIELNVEGSFQQEGNTGGEFNEDDDSSMNSL